MFDCSRREPDSATMFRYYRAKGIGESSKECFATDKELTVVLLNISISKEDTSI